MNCSCCGENSDVQMHHLYPKSQGCPDDLTVPLCYSCHRRSHGLETTLNHSELVKAALAAAKARGTKLGWAIPTRAVEAKAANAASAQVRGEKADNFAERMRTILTSFAAGTSLGQIAADLNARGISTARGGKWQAVTVQRVMARLEGLA